MECQADMVFNLLEAMLEHDLLCVICACVVQVNDVIKNPYVTNWIPPWAYMGACAGGCVVQVSLPLWV